MMHITEKQLSDYMSGNMAYGEQAGFLEHISVCMSCAGRLADTMQGKGLYPVPPDLKNNILRQTVYKKTKAVYKKEQTIYKKEFRKIPYKNWHIKIRRKQEEFWMYTAEIIFAASVAVAVILAPSGSLQDSIAQSREGRFSLTKEITREEVENSAKIQELFRYTSKKISGDISRALKLDKQAEK